MLVPAYFLANLQLRDMFREDIQDFLELFNLMQDVHYNADRNHDFRFNDCPVCRRRFLAIQSAHPVADMEHCPSCCREFPAAAFYAELVGQDIIKPEVLASYAAFAPDPACVPGLRAIDESEIKRYKDSDAEYGWTNYAHMFAEDAEQMKDHWAVGGRRFRKPSATRK